MIYCFLYFRGDILSLGNNFTRTESPASKQPRQALPQLLFLLGKNVLLVWKPNISTGNKGASVIYMGVMPGTQQFKKYSILQGKTWAVARHSFSVLWPKLKIHCCFLVLHAVSVLLALYPVK